MKLVTMGDIRSAADRIMGLAVRTPLVPCPWGDPDRPLWLKPENLQPIGAFKIRGAGAAISASMTGVVTHSSGNHGQAVAYVAKKLGIPAVVVVPDSASPVKLDAMRDLGAELVIVPPADRLLRAEEIKNRRGLTMIPPFDHPDIIAGQGTIGLEIATDLSNVDVVLVPVGGGGLASGVGVAIRALAPHAKIFGVEPELAADARDSLKTGQLTSWSVEKTQRTIADGLRVTSLTQLTFEHLKNVLDGILTVTEEHIKETIGVLARKSHLIAEPSGAVTTAAYLHRKAELPSGRTVAVLSGGNIDPAFLREVL